MPQQSRETSPERSARAPAGAAGAAGQQAPAGGGGRDAFVNASLRRMNYEEGREFLRPEGGGLASALEPAAGAGGAPGSAAGVTSRPQTKSAPAEGAAETEASGAIAFGAMVASPRIEPGKAQRVGDLDLGNPTAKKIHKAEPSLKPHQDRTWKRVADFVGVHIELLQAFNADLDISPLAEAAPEVTVYVPSPQEVLFLQYCREADPSVTGLEVRTDAAGLAKRLPEAAAKLQGLRDAGALAVVEQARVRASGETGDAYATKSPWAYSPNPNMGKGKTEAVVDGRTERVGRWGSHANKCNLYAHDVTHAAGLDTPIQGNRHYATAGSTWEHYTTKAGEESQAKHLFDEVSFEDARPGDQLVLYGSSREDESHIEVVTSRADSDSVYTSGAHNSGAWETRHFSTLDALKKAMAPHVEAELARIRARTRHTTETQIEKQRSRLEQSLRYELHFDLLKGDARFVRHKAMK